MGKIFTALALATTMYWPATALAASDQDIPGRGLSKAEVRAQFGEPRHTRPSVGKPPITRWDYDGFSVYFENDTSLHSVREKERAPAAEPSHWEKADAGCISTTAARYLTGTAVGGACRGGRDGRDDGGDGAAEDGASLERCRRFVGLRGTLCAAEAGIILSGAGCWLPGECASPAGAPAGSTAAAPLRRCLQMQSRRLV